MAKSWNALWRDEHGLVLSAELIVIVTIVVLGLITGLACVQQAVVGELQDLSGAFRGLNQSYGFSGFRGCFKSWGQTSWTSGSRFSDVNAGYYPGMAGIGFSEIGGWGYASGAGGGYVGGAAGGRAVVTESCPNCPAPPTGCTTCPPAAATPTPPQPACPTCEPSPQPLSPAEIPAGPVPQPSPQL